MTPAGVGAPATRRDGSGTPHRPLDGIRVVGTIDAIGGAYVGRLFADLGADVVTLEAADGGALRRMGPFVAGDGCRVSAAAAYFLAGTRAVTAERTSQEGRDRLAELLAGADVVMRTDPALPTDAELDVAEQANPGLIVADVSTFGRTGDAAESAGGDLVALAASGMLSVTSTNPADGPLSPVRVRGELTSVFASCHAAVAILGALHARLTDGVGQRVDVAAIEAMVGTMATALPQVTYTGLVPVAGGARGVCPWAIYTARDGQLLVQCTEDSQWRALVGMLGDPDWGHLEVFETTAQRIEQSDVIDSLVQDAVAGRTVEELLRTAHEVGVPACRLHTPEDAMNWEQLRVRRSFRELEVAGRPVVAPASPIRFRDVPAVPCPTTPAIGADDERVRWSPRTAAPDGPPGAPAAPLAGLRVLDLTWVWAGPFAAMQLAHLGADVIKVESRGRIDVTRRLGPFADEVPGVDRSGYFNQYNQGKRSILLDPTTAEGKDVLAQLVEHADLVIDNMRAGALARMGFDDDRLRDLNPRIVAVAMTGYGETGPERDRLAYGSLIDALAGITATTGPVDGPATEIPMSLPDPNAGLHAAIAGLAGLYRARTTGLGADIECSMIESWISALPWGVLTSSATGSAPPRIGTRDEQMSPHGTFPAAGDHSWIAIAVEDDAQFAGLADVIGRPDLSRDRRFSTLAARQANEQALETIVSAWTSQRERDIAVAELAAAGVTAVAVRTIDEVAACPHLWARGFYLTPDHPAVGRRPLAGPPWRTSRSPMVATTPAPTLGQHTDAVLREVLGMDDVTIAGLIASGTAG